MFKKFYLVALVIVLLGGFIFAGSASASEKKIVLKFGHMVMPDDYVATHCINPFAKKLEEATGGRVQIIMYPSESLITGDETYEGVKGGIADIGWLYHGFFPGRFPLSSVLFLPAVGVSSTVAAGKAHADLYRKFPEIQAEYPGIKVLAVHAQSPSFIATSKKPIRTLEDVKGMKLRIAGKPAIDYMKALNAVPMSITFSDMHSSMEKGIVAGYSTDWAALDAGNLYDVTKYVTRARLVSGGWAVIMNLKKWQKLPEDIQQAIDKTSWAFAQEFFDKPSDDIIPMVEKKCAERGIEIIELSQQEKARWKSAAKPIHEQWIAEMESKGLPGRAVYDEYLRLVEKYSK